MDAAGRNGAAGIFWLIGAANTVERVPVARPFASFLWPGNTADVTRLTPVVERLRTRFGINKVCVVADRGMISAATIAALEQQNIDYILGARERSTTEIREMMASPAPLLIPRQKGATELAIKDTTVGGRRYVLCRNEEETRKDAEARVAIIASLERKLAQGDKALVGNKGYRRFLATPGDEHFTINRHPTLITVVPKTRRARGGCPVRPRLRSGP
jgi:Transposase DDE domain